MKIGLKGVKHSAFASQETHSFEAILTIDAVPAFHVSNEGHGGPNSYRPLPRQSHEDFQARFASVEQYVKAPPKRHAFGEMIDESLETIVGGLVNDWLSKRELARMLKSKIVLIEEGKVYTLKPSGKAAGAPTAQLIANAAKIHPKATILNGLSKELAEALYIEAINPKRDQGDAIETAPSP